MLKNNKALKLVLFLELLVFILIVMGVLPRIVVPSFVFLLVLYLIWAPLEEGVMFFAASIPLFLAIPITTSFDNFNSWRIFSAVLFIKWAIPKFWPGIKAWLKSPKTLTMTVFVQRPSLYRVWIIGLVVLAVLAVASILVAGDKVLAIKRVIYFANLSLIGFVVADLAKNRDFTKKLINYLAYSTILVTVAGFLQLASTYFLDIYQFMRVWGENIQCNQFGQEWCNIAVQFGNTWFAYYGDQLSLRMFSLFPDSHSFPIFLLLGLPVIFAVAMSKMDLGYGFKKFISTRTGLSIVWVPIIFLAITLTGTRGFWASSLGVVALAAGLLIYMRIRRNDRLKFFGFISSYMSLFFILFLVAYPIFISPQFLLSKGDMGMFGNRIRSVIDFGETSNAQRIEIWKKTLASIKEKPLLGVGIGNYPIVLSQDLRLSRAGSSAHNLYLHIAAEMGVAALILALIILIDLFRRIYKKFTVEKDIGLAAYYGSALLFIPWVFGYSMTDVAIFDERAFLMFVISVAIFVNKKSQD